MTERTGQTTTHPPSSPIINDQPSITQLSLINDRSPAEADRRLAAGLKLHSTDNISFVHGKMVIRHREFSIV